MNLIKAVTRYQPEATPLYPYNVQIWRSLDNGRSFYYTGNGKFFQTAEAAAEYSRAHDNTTRYQVDYIDPVTGAKSPIDVIDAGPDYTADDYISQCKANADEDYITMLRAGAVTVTPCD